MAARNGLPVGDRARPLYRGADLQSLARPAGYTPAAASGAESGSTLWLRARGWQFLIILVFVGASIWQAATLIRTTGVPDLGARQLRRDDLVIPFDAEHSLTQTFVATAPGLSRIDVAFHSLQEGRPGAAIVPSISLELRDAREIIIAAREYPAPAQAGDFDLSLEVAPQEDSRGSTYVLKVRTTAAPDLLSIWSSSFNVYRAGALDINELRIDRDLTFSTFGRPEYRVLDGATARRLAMRLQDLVTISLASLVLGIIVTTLLTTRRHGSFTSAAAYAVPAAICLPPVLFSVLSWLGIPIGITGLLVATSVMLPAAVVRVWHAGLRIHRTDIPGREIVAVGSLFLVALFLRAVQINDLTVPNWVDGVMHAHLLRQVQHVHGFPAGSVYHLGFHANVIVAQALTGRSLPESMLVYGQWLSAASGLCFYVLARKLFKDVRLALITTGIFWFVSPFPAYLFTWGRYSFLQGLALLPAAAGIVLMEAEGKPQRPLQAFVLAGLFLSHYAAALLALSFMVAVLIHQRRREPPVLTVRRLAVAMLVVVPLAAAAAAIILGSVASGRWSRLTWIFFHPTSTAEAQHLLSLMASRGGLLALVLGAAGCLLAVVRPVGFFRLIAVWAALSVGVFAIQDKFLGITAFSIQNVLIFLSIPGSLLGGLVFRTLMTLSFRPVRALAYLGAALLILAGVYNGSGMLNPETVFFSVPDRAAMDWIRRNTSLDSRILVNSFQWRGHYEESDGGAWIRQSTGRRTFFLTEARDFARLDEMLSERRIDYVYVGSGYGDLGLFAPNDPMLKAVYQSGGITIYSVRRQSPTSCVSNAESCMQESRSYQSEAWPCAPVLPTCEGIRG